MEKYWKIPSTVPDLNLIDPQAEAEKREVLDYKCVECDARFTLKSRMERHLLIHSNDRPFECTVCGKGFKNTSNLNQHRRIHDNGPFNCKFCSLIFLKRRECEEHKYVCSFMPEKMKLRLKSQEVKKYVCNICDKSFTNNSHLKRHKICVHENKRNYTCNYSGCPQAFNTANDLKNHQKIVHMGMYEAQCLLCQTKFANNSLLTLHMKASHDESRNRFSCDLCSTTFRSKSKILLHMRKIHKKIPSRSAVCEHCGKIMSSSSLMDHVLTVHFNQRDHMCSLCNATFTTKHRLNTHFLRKHSDERNFICGIPQCQKAFKTRQDLLQHQTRHDLNPLQCGYCFQQFSNDEEYKSHMNSCSSIFTPPKTKSSKKLEYKCEFCSKIFQKMSNLKRHRVCVHENKKNLKCLYQGCDRAFNDISALRRHKKTVHKIEDYRDVFNDLSIDVDTEVSTTKSELNFEGEPDSEPESIQDFRIDQDVELYSEHKVELINQVTIKQEPKDFIKEEEITELEISDCLEVKKEDETAIKEENELEFDGEENFQDESYHQNDSDSADSQEEKPLSSYKKQYKYKCKNCEKSYRTVNELEKHKKIVHEGIKNFICSIEDCQKSFAYEKSLRHHVEVHHNDDFEKIACSNCNKVFTNKEGLKKHRESFHEGIRYSCAYCERSFTRKSNLKDHFEGCENRVKNDEPPNPKKKFKCDQCTKYFRKNHELDKHKKYVHEGIKNFMCSEENCEKTFAFEKSLKHHIAVHHSNNFEKISCDMCDKEFIDKDGLRKHQQAVHQGLRHYCEICKQSFGWKSGLRKHFEAKHSGKPIAPRREIVKKVNCEECGILIQKSSLFKHKVSMHNYPIDSVYECDLCGVQKRFRINLVHHMKVNHSQRTKFPCETCGKQLSNLTALKNHIQIVHEKIVRFFCEHCGSGHPTRERYINHIRAKHTLEKPYKCNDCDKSYTNHSSLNTHRIYEHTYDPKVCDICSETFINNKKLKRHKKQDHPGKQSKSSRKRTKKDQGESEEFVCKYPGCGLSFPFERQLNNHAEAHSGERQYICEICNFAYRKKFGLTSHIRAVHLKFLVKCEVEGCGIVCSRKDALRRHIKNVHKELTEDNVRYLYQRIEDLPLPPLSNVQDLPNAGI